MPQISQPLLGIFPRDEIYRVLKSGGETGLSIFTYLVQYKNQFFAFIFASSNLLFHKLTPAAFGIAGIKDEDDYVAFVHYFVERPHIVSPDLLLGPL